MKNKTLLVIVVILIFINIVVISTKKEPNHSFFTPENTIKIKNQANQIEELNLEEYLIGVIAAEMPASFHEEALKAQAVAARTYALYKINTNKDKNYDILTDVTNQSYITKEEMQKKWQNEYNLYLNKITKAVNETAKEVMFYNDNIIEAFYFAMSNGKTENAETVFQEKLPFIKSVASTWDNENLNNFSVTTNFSTSEFCTKLNLSSCQNITITNINKNNTNHITDITINNQTFSGTNFRKLLNLRSTDFEITKRGNNITITTKGYGHGVGMSQYGANGMAKEGYNYKQILNYYYNDISINKMV